MSSRTKPKASILRRATRAASRKPSQQRGTPAAGWKILSTGVTVSASLLSLLGGLALVVKALENTDLTLSLALTKTDEPSKLERTRADAGPTGRAIG